MQTNVPPPFEIGNTYLDGKGEYTVVAFKGKSLKLKRPNGFEEIGEVDLKARIHNRITSERASEFIPGRQPKSRGGTLEWFYEMIAEKLTEYAKRSADYMAHDDILNSLLNDPDAGPPLVRFSMEDPEQKSPVWWAGSRIAFFSQQWTLKRGAFRYDGPFERQGVGGDYEYRKRTKPAGR